MENQDEHERGTDHGMEEGGRAVPRWTFERRKG